MIRDAMKERGIPLIRPHRLQIEGGYIREIGRAELKNILFSLYLKFGRYNNGFEIAIAAYEKSVKIERKELEKEISSGREQSHNRDKKGKNEGK